MDLLASPEDIADQIRANNIKADYVFFFAYIQPNPKDGGNIWSAAEDLVRINSEYTEKKVIELLSKPDMNKKKSSLSTSLRPKCLPTHCLNECFSNWERNTMVCT